MALAAASVAVSAAAAPKEPALVVPFRYEGFGMGAGVVDGAVTLTKNAEAQFVSRALVSTLQDRQLSIVSPRVTLGEPLPQGKTFTTDIAPVSPALIAQHMRDHPEIKPFPSDRKWAVQYTGQYKLQNRELVFAISAQLYEEVAASQRRKYKGDYSGNFFVNGLSAALRTKLLQQAAAAPPP